MKYLTLILAIVCLNTFGQSGLSFSIKNAKGIALPYTTDQFANRKYFDSKQSLHANDSAFVINQLLKAPHLIINRYGENSFGNLDYPDSSFIENPLKDANEISIIGVLRLNKSYLVHLNLHQELSGMSIGILALMSETGEIYNWFFSDGSANSGNPHGNISRDFTITLKKTIKIEEVSWGDNTDNYNFTSNLIIHKNFDDGNYAFQIKHIGYDYNGYGLEK